MMKKLSTCIAVIATVAFGCQVCSAAVIPSQGPGQIGFSSVILCESLSLHSEAAAESPVSQTLLYNDRIIVMNQENGWAHVVLGDSEDSPSGWVSSEYIAVDPAYYVTDEETPVYAWNDTSAPKVALLDQGTSLPILKDNGEWLIVSLRAATGWVHVPNRTQAETTEAKKSETKESSTTQTTAASASAGTKQTEAQSAGFTVYAKDGSTVTIHHTEGATYEDARGRTYIKQDDDAFYYCITTDTTYALDPTQWTGEAYGENEFPEDAEPTVDYGDSQDYTGADYGENQDWTGEDYGENQDLTGEDYGENQDWTGEDYGENQG